MHASLAVNCYNVTVFDQDSGHFQGAPSTNAQTYHNRAVRIKRADLSVNYPIAKREVGVSRSSVMSRRPTINNSGTRFTSTFEFPVHVRNRSWSSAPQRLSGIDLMSEAVRGRQANLLGGLRGQPRNGSSRTASRVW
jgi:hypothetical protein